MVDGEIEKTTRMDFQGVLGEWQGFIGQNGKNGFKGVLCKPGGVQVDVYGEYGQKNRLGEIGFWVGEDTWKIKGKIEMNNQNGFPGGFRSLVDSYRVE